MTDRIQDDAVRGVDAKQAYEEALGNALVRVAFTLMDKSTATMTLVDLRAHLEWILNEYAAACPTSADRALFDWAESNPELALKEINCWWANAVAGFREDHFNIRGAIRSARDTAAKGGKP